MAIWVIFTPPTVLKYARPTPPRPLFLPNSMTVILSLKVYILRDEISLMIIHRMYLVVFL